MNGNNDRNPNQKEKILCIPGLGGHPSAFGQYVRFLPEYELVYMEFVNREKALSEARARLAAEERPMILLCHCYSAQMGIQLAAEMPDKVSRLIFLEPFFSEFQPWMKIFKPINTAVLWITKFFAGIGVHRRNFKYEPDYIALAKYPIYFQPFFDMRWQGLPDYFDKCYDILNYRLPPKVLSPTLMMFSPQGFSRNPAIKEKLNQIFSKGRIVEMREGTHNVITMGAESVVAIIKEYLRNSIK